MAFSNAQLAVLLSSQCCSMPEPGQPVQGHAVRGGAVQHRHRVRLKNCRITIIKVGQGHRQRGRVAGPKSWPQQQLRQQWGNNVVCNCRLINSVAKRIRATPPPSNVFHFFSSAFSCSSSCFALSHILNVYCNCYCCCCCCSLFLLLLAVNRIWQHWQRYGGRGAESCQAGLGSLGFMATLHCKTGATFSALLCSTLFCSTPASAWALHLKAVINNLITDFVSVRHKQH